MWLRNKHFYIPITALRYWSFSGVSRTGWPMKFGNQKKTNKTQKDWLLRVLQKSSALQNAKEPNTHGRRFYKKSLQEMIRSAYEKEFTSKDLPSMGQKNSSRLCRFFDSLVSESSECESSQHIQKQNKTIIQNQKRTTSHRDPHNIFQQHARLYARGVFFRREGFRGSRRTERITSSRSAATGNKVTPLNFSKVLQLKTVIPSRQNTQPRMMCLSWAQKDEDENNSSH